MQFFLKNRKVKDNSKFNEAEGLKDTNSEKRIFLLLGKQNKVFIVQKLPELGGNSKIAHLIKLFFRNLSNLDGNISPRSRKFIYTQE